MPARKSPGKAQERRLFDEAMCCCPFCPEPKIGILTLELHHIDGDRSNTVDANLIAVCANCHTRIEKGDITQAQVMAIKRVLVMGFHTHELAREKWRPQNVVTVSGATNHGIIANTVKFQTTAKTGPIILPGTIGASPKHFNYTEYLIKRLAAFRSWAPGGCRGYKKVNSGSVRKILSNQLGGLVKDLEISRFEDVVSHIKSKIDDTALGRINRAKGTANYHKFEEHGKTRNKKVADQD